MNAAPMLCVTVGERIPSNPSQTNPSVNWWTANSVGSDAKSNSRRCFTFVNVTTPMVPSTPLPTKFAVAEKHMARPLPFEDYSAVLTRPHRFEDEGRRVMLRPVEVLTCELARGHLDRLLEGGLPCWASMHW
jgi:hypothetical protein